MNKLPPFIFIKHTFRFSTTWRTLMWELTCEPMQNTQSTECQIINMHLKKANLAHVENNYTWLPLHMYIICMQAADIQRLKPFSSWLFCLSSYNAHKQWPTSVMMVCSQPQKAGESLCAILQSPCGHLTC